MNNLNKNTIICFVAHPDDEVLGLGGTLIKHVNQKDDVHIIIFSLGEESKNSKDINAERRLSSAKKCSKIIGSKSLKLLNYPDQKIDTVPKLEIIKKIENIIYKLKPNIVYTHHEGDINHDHQIINHAVLTALRPMTLLGHRCEVRTFETISSTEQSPYIDKYLFKPNFFVDIESEWEKKMIAIKAYKDELGVFPHPRSIKSIEALAIKRGTESGLKKAEAFRIIRKIWH
ncbi:MAG: N-acetyl-alpha-D-glucosaminyl L-malate deacetylase 1 [Alphaproteobacteria bacterium MarineAlpha9_Bin3]|nr:MAG: N-acetyl-alpha-D-glucosaminyl L-malate deacetylase 1 [Alphaproteobacteria bacterium MarineAlpha9_Bin3]|tara:strand:+ start:470 stop:1159 length:690 start_codon:yes stop_codon:yes gene_type:complete